MKQNIFKLWAFFIVIALVSCKSTDDSPSGDFAQSNTTILQLKEYNASITQNLNVLTRAKNNKWYKDLSIVMADFGGAAKGVQWGHKFALTAGAMSGGTGYFATTVAFGAVIGCGASYLAYLDKYGYNIKDKNLTTDGPLFLNAKSSLTSSLEYFKGNVANQNFNNVIFCKLAIPEKYKDLKCIGENHNGLLQEILLDDASLVSPHFVGGGPIISGGLKPAGPGTWNTGNGISSSYMARVLENDTIKFAYNQIAETKEVLDYKKYIKDNIESNKVRETLLQYAALFETLPLTTENMIQTVNDYVAIIEKNSDFSEEEKSIVYSAMIVSLYSNYLWTEVIQ